jgi:hypothetical protein
VQHGAAALARQQKLELLANHCEPLREVSAANNNGIGYLAHDLQPELLAHKLLIAQ